MLELIEVTKEYVMGGNVLKALDSISLKVDQGEYLSIIGPSGSGKSTLMNIIGCLDVADIGKYYIDGKEVSEYSDDQLSDIRNKKIGFVFQKFNLLPRLSALENVELSLVYRGIKLKERKEIAESYLKKVGLQDRQHHKPNELSGGQQQRVAIARALAGNPPIILADEPTGNLDSKSGREVMDILQELKNDGKTVILITHDLDVAEQGKRIINIRDGKLTEERVVS